MIMRENKNARETLTHRARLCFLRNGDYVVSACVKVTATGRTCKEIWWSPKAKPIVVVKKASQ